MRDNTLAEELGSQPDETREAPLTSSARGASPELVGFAIKKQSPLLFEKGIKRYRNDPDSSPSPMQRQSHEQISLRRRSHHRLQQEL